MAVNHNHLFGLYSGQQITRWDLLKGSLGGNIRVGEGRDIVVFNRHTGEPISRFRLDDWGAAIAVDDEYMYVLNISRNPSVNVYKIPD